MEFRTTTSKPAPLKMVHFLTELMTDLPMRGRVVSVEVDGSSYIVTVERADGAIAVHQLSAWDVSRSMRGDATAVATIRHDFLSDGAVAR